METLSAQYWGEIINNHYFEGLTVGTTAYHTHTTNDEFHSHDKPTICFMLHGGGVEKRRNNSYERCACDVRFYHADELHQSIIKIFPSKCVNLELDSHFLHQYEITESLLNLAVTNNLNVRFLMLKIHSELMMDDAWTNSSVKILLLSMLHETKNTLIRKKPEWITNLHQLLNDNWAETMSLEDLASIINVHPVTISKNFTRYFSCTLGEYMRKVKVDKSISLITSSDLSLTEIAFRCGFADQSHFIRNFKKLTGFLPKDIKRL